MTEEGFSISDAKRLAKLYPMADPREWCESVATEDYVCTRKRGHDGPHVAHNTTAEVSARWPGIGGGRQMNEAEVDTMTRKHECFDCSKWYHPGTWWLASSLCRRCSHRREDCENQ